MSGLIFLHPPKKFYSDDTVTRGLVGMAPHVLNTAALNNLRHQWDGDCIAPTSAGLTTALMRSTSEPLVMQALDGRLLAGKVHHLRSGGILRTQEAGLHIPHHEQGHQLWGYELIGDGGEGKGGRAYIRAWKADSWSSGRGVKAMLHGHAAHEVIVQFIYESDEWGYANMFSDVDRTGKVRNRLGMARSDREEEQTGLEDMLIQNHKETEKFRDRLGELEATLDDVIARRKSKHKKYSDSSGWMNCTSKIRELGDEAEQLEEQRRGANDQYYAVVKQVAGEQTALNMLVMERGWKALVLAGMQLLEITTTDRRTPFR